MRHSAHEPAGGGRNDDVAEFLASGPNHQMLTNRALQDTPRLRLLGMESAVDVVIENVFAADSDS